MHVNRTYPDSCCAADIAEQFSISRRPLASAVVFRSDLVDDLVLDDVTAGRNFSDISDAWSLITAPSSTTSVSSSISSSSAGSTSSALGGAGSSSLSSGSSNSVSGSGNSGGLRSSSASVSSSSTVSGGDSGNVRTVTTCRAVYPQVGYEI